MKINKSPRAFPLWMVLATGLAGAAFHTTNADTLFTVRQSFSIPDAKQGKARGWFWMPEDRPEQKVLEFRIPEAPPTTRITRDPRHGRAWLYAETDNQAARPLKIVTEFKVLRKAVSGLADPAKARPLTGEDRRAFAAELRADEKHMEITPEIRQIARRLAGDETNPVLLARKCFDFVIQKSEHYSKSGPKAKGLQLGSATECLEGRGDTCTDQHALFIALCRAQGIPCRLSYGSRVKPENAGRDFDPGYRCWPKFFAPGNDWVPVDVSSGDTAAAGQAHAFFGGLDENRLEWAEGRDFNLEPASAHRPDLVIRGWVELDGKPHSPIQRTVHFTRQSVTNVKAMAGVAN